ncbi:MAG: hypothetical protein V4736_11670 [Bdellovibrionota bacterium]
MFRTRAYGKWILAGEHSVLRGTPAIVFPLFSRWLEFDFMPKAGSELQLEIEEGFGDEFRLLFWSVFQKACQSLGVGPTHFHGQIRLRSNLQIGAGQGASASLCIACARWFHAQNLITQSEIVPFARKMENIFHGESSGVDVSVVQAEKPLHYERDGKMYPLEIKWQPKFYLSYSGKKGMTYECVQKVKNLLSTLPDVGQALDEKMRVASLLCEQGLLSDERDGFEMLKEGVDKAKACFNSWDLITPEMHQLMETLNSAGAQACKPTGSGGGGFILSLWKETPPANLTLIPCFV